MSFLAPIVGTGIRAVAGRVIGSRIAPTVARYGSKIAGSASIRLGEFGMGRTANALGHAADDLGSLTAAQASRIGATRGMQVGFNAPMGAGGSQKQNFNEGIDVQSMYGA